MRHTPILPLVLAVTVGACSQETGSPLADAPTGPSEPSGLLIQAVDAGTGGALSDESLTVRHLVRFPITLDASAVEEVASAEPYRIQHAVAWDSLVVEVRLEAPSYYRLDTALTVARGASAGPLTLRMTRRLDRGGRAAQSTPRPAATPSSGTPAPAAADPDAAIDRAPLRAGDQAFQRQQWAQATNAYLNMPAPPQRTGTYAQEYARSRIRLAEAHINLGEWGGALDALEVAVTFQGVDYTAHLLLGQAQCTVGRLDDGRRTLDGMSRIATSLPSSQRATAHALAGYQKANCAHQEFTRAQAAMDVLRLGSAAIQEYEAFIAQGEALSPIPAPVATALEQARTRIEEIRERMRGR